jgi:hypothetical protein
MTPPTTKPSPTEDKSDYPAITAALNEWRSTLSTSPPPWHGPKPPKLPTPPTFQPATWAFGIDDTFIAVLRSRWNETDTDTITANLQVGSNPAQTITKSLGNLGTGEHPIGVTFAPVEVPAPTTPVIMNYTIVNAGGSNASQLKTEVEQAGTSAAGLGIKALTAALGTLVGAEIGSVVLPIIGTALGAFVGYLISEGVDALFADCDGVVAFEQAALNGQALWNATPYAHSTELMTEHSGTDSPHGCGANSLYDVSWGYSRL